MIRQMIDKYVKKLNRNKGFSLSEMLVAVLILSLVAIGLAGGITTSIRVYKESTMYSESQTFSNTVITAIEDELRYSTEQETGSNNPKFTSSTYGSDVKIYIPSSGTLAGKIVIGNDAEQSLLVSQGLYPSGVTLSMSYKYAKDSGYVLDLTIKDAEGNKITEIKELVIVPLNK